MGVRDMWSVLWLLSTELDWAMKLHFYAFPGAFHSKENLFHNTLRSCDFWCHLVELHQKRLLIRSGLWIYVRGSQRPLPQDVYRNKSRIKTRPWAFYWGEMVLWVWPSSEVSHNEEKWTQQGQEVYDISFPCFRPVRLTWLYSLEMFKRQWGPVPVLSLGRTRSPSERMVDNFSTSASSSNSDENEHQLRWCRSKRSAFFASVTRYTIYKSEKEKGIKRLRRSRLQWAHGQSCKNANKSCTKPALYR